ncbi:related to Pre-mRNA-splicing factor BRR1 [Zygosaccharomyces bailii]|nr:related to Pre-mRNA-splicing factor BRR1 [Zygosaccharomyces bailii]
MDTENQVVDAVFGQPRAFSLESSLVNPNVIKYLETVRQEALRTNAISNAGRSTSRKHTADLYDDDELTRTIPVSLRLFEKDMIDWIKWFTNAKQIVMEEGLAAQKHDADTLNLLLYYLKGYISAQEEQKGISTHILNILQELDTVHEDEHLEIDPAWAEHTLKNLRTEKIRDLEDLKAFITGASESVPVGFKEWYRFCQGHEPSHCYFTGTINSRNIWVLVQYMSHDWIKDIHKQKKANQVRRFSAWLLYILFHLPTNITAEYVSNLRELGKKCQRLILTDAIAEDPKTGVLVQHLMTSEMIDLAVPAPPRELDIIKLALTVITVLYRQRDLINWKDFL